MVNASKGAAADLVNTTNTVVHMPGESTAAFPVTAAGLLCLPAVLKFNAKNLDTARVAFLSELFEEIVLHVTLKRLDRAMTLAETMHAQMSAEDSATVKEELRKLKAGILPGCEVQAPRPVTNLRNLFIREETARITVADSSVLKKTACLQASKKWSETYAKDVGAQTRELKDLKAEQAKLVFEHKTVVEEYRGEIPSFLSNCIDCGLWVDS